jgi:signal recognition particle GTPase
VSYLTTFLIFLFRKNINFYEVSGVMNNKSLIEEIVSNELIKLLDPEVEPFKPQKGRPNVIMFVGLQGAGKTTSCTKVVLVFYASFNPFSLDGLLLSAKGNESCVNLYRYFSCWRV